MEDPRRNPMPYKPDEPMGNEMVLVFFLLTALGAAGGFVIGWIVRGG